MRRGRDLKQGFIKGTEMNKCDWCNLSEEDEKYLLLDSGYWSVFLADEQDYIGRCILVLKRHCGSMAELTDVEWMDLLNLIRKLEMCLKTVLDADLCNWSCLMNSFFKESEPCPHLHIHVRPRYRNPVVINGNTYSDDSFGHHYSTKKNARISAEDIQTVFNQMKSRLN